jgi:hypothetical protein
MSDNNEHYSDDARPGDPTPGDLIRVIMGQLEPGQDDELSILGGVEALVVECGRWPASDTPWVRVAGIRPPLMLDEVVVVHRACMLPL